jgi:hypothetical protein
MLLHKIFLSSKRAGLSDPGQGFDLLAADDSGHVCEIDIAQYYHDRNIVNADDWILLEWPQCMPTTGGNDNDETGLCHAIG